MLLPFAREQNELKMVSPHFLRIVSSVIPVKIIELDMNQLN